MAGIRNWYPSTTRKRLCIVAVVAISVALLFPRLGVRYRIHQARSALEQRDAQLAVDWLTPATGQHRQLGEIHFLLGRAYRRLGQSELVRKHLDSALSYGWPDESIHREWILAQAQSGLMNQAEPYFARLLADPGEDGPEICAAYANGYAHHYQFQKTFDILYAWQADYPDDAEPYLMHGIIRQRWDDWSAAEEAFRSALKREPNLIEAHSRLGLVLAAQHKYQEALEHFRICLADDNENYDTRLAWADCLMNLGRHTEARKVYLKLIRDNDDDCTVRAGLAKIALQAGNWNESLKWVRPAVERCPREIAVRYVFGQALAASGDTDAAQQHLDYSVAATESLTRATQLISKLINNPDDLETRFELGRIALDYNSAEDGVNWLNTVLAVDPDHRATHKLLADYYSSIGDQQKASEHRKIIDDSDS